MRAHDELGRPWLILEGDPAWDLARGLKGDVALPVETLIRTTIPHPARVEDQLRKLELAWQVTGDKDIQEAYLRAAALHGCLTSCYNRDGGTDD